MAPILLWLKQHLSKMLQTSTTLVYQNTKKQYHGVSAMPCKQRLYKFLIFPEFSSPLFTVAQWNGSAANLTVTICTNRYYSTSFPLRHGKEVGTRISCYSQSKCIAATIPRPHQHIYWCRQFPVPYLIVVHQGRVIWGMKIYHLRLW